jgi:hypothetical protein
MHAEMTMFVGTGFSTAAPAVREYLLKGFIPVFISVHKLTFRCFIFSSCSELGSE